VTALRKRGRPRKEGQESLSDVNISVGSLSEKSDVKSEKSDISFKIRGFTSKDAAEVGNFHEFAKTLGNIWKTISQS